MDNWIKDSTNVSTGGGSSAYNSSTSYYTSNGGSQFNYYQSASGGNNNSYTGNTNIHTKSYAKKKKGTGTVASGNTTTIGSDRGITQNTNLNVNLYGSGGGSGYGIGGGTRTIYVNLGTVTTGGKLLKGLPKPTKTKYVPLTGNDTMFSDSVLSNWLDEIKNSHNVAGHAFHFKTSVFSL